MTKLLSIVIPTIGNPELLRISLDSLTQQIERHLDEVELIVSFNSPSQEAVDMIEDYEKSHSYVYHKVFQERVEIVPSIVRTIRLATGKYILAFGDDDVAYPYLLEEILPLLRERNNLSIIHFNVIKGKDHGDHSLRGLSLEYDNFNPNNELMSIGNFLKKHAISPGFISSFVFSKQSFEKGADEDYSENKGYGFLMLIYKGAVDTNCVYISRPLVMQRQPYNRIWLDKWPYYCLIDIPHLMNWIEKIGLSDGIVEHWDKTDNASFAKYCYTLLMASAYKTKYMPLCKRINVYQKSCIRRILTYLIIYCVPSFIYPILRRIMYK